MKRFLTAILVIAFTCSTFFAQGEYPSDRLLESPLKQFERERIDKLNREAKEKSKILENSPLANRATGFSLFFRLIGEHPTAERLESDKYRLETIGIENISEQNLIFEKAKEFISMSNANKYVAEQTVVKKHHTDGNKQHTDFTEEDKKTLKKLQDAKAKELKKIIKSLEKDISSESFSAIENYVLNVINPSTTFHLTPKGEIEVERLKRDGKKSVTSESECYECYPPNGEEIYNGYVYDDTIYNTKSSNRNPEIESLDGLVVDAEFHFTSESAYEVDPISNAHGINFVSEVRDFESGASVSLQSTAVNWFALNPNGIGEQTYYSLENFVSTESGGFDKRILYDVWCGASYSYTQNKNYYFGTSNLIMWYRFIDHLGGIWFEHERHESTGGLCDTHCGNWTDRRIGGMVAVRFKNRTIFPGELNGATAIFVVPWGARDKTYKLPWHENSINNWCANLGVGAGLKFYGYDLNPFSICFDKSINVGWIWN